MQVTLLSQSKLIDSLAAYAFLVMTLIYVPCVATIAAIRQETGRELDSVGCCHPPSSDGALAVGVYQVGSLLLGLKDWCFGA